MSTPSPAPGAPSADACAELRAAVATRCEEAHRTKTEYEAATEHMRDLRRDLVSARRHEEAALAEADPALRSADKDKAREAYQQARQLAQDDDELQAASAAWAESIDRINRSARLTQRAASKTRAAVGALEQALREADRAPQAARMQAEAAEAACLDARVRLASCEEGAMEQTEAAIPTVFEPHAATGGHATAITSSAAREPLVIESMLSGDRRALELAAEMVGEHTGLAPAQARLQLQELVDVIVSLAAEEGFLIFDVGHPFWSALTQEEGRDVIAALARLGFQFEPTEGWHAGRAPAPSDLSMALAYAGLDARNMRDLPSADQLRGLPQSIGVDARAFLSAQAPDLAVDHIVNLLGRRAEQLEPLWDEWGQVRPILLSPRHDLGSLQG